MTVLQSGDLTVEIGGLTFELMPERTLFFPAERLLVTADLHLGKSVDLRLHFSQLPSGVTAGDLARLAQAILRKQARHVVLLGDVLHSASGFHPMVGDAMRAWRHSIDAEIWLVRGNHDRRAGDPPRQWELHCVNEPFRRFGLVLAHHPELADAEGDSSATSGACRPGDAQPDRKHHQDEPYRLAGHVHPAVRLRGPARQSARMPCFILGPLRGLLPAFGGLTGTGTVLPGAQDRVFIAGDAAVIEISRRAR